MKKEDLDAISKASKEKYDGDLDVAIAAHLMGDVVITRAGGIVPAGADYDTIAEIRKSIEKPKAPAKKK